MRSPPRTWLTLTQSLLLLGCSDHLPLDVDGRIRDRDKLPVELAGNGGDFGAGARAGGPGWNGSAMQEPRRNTAICGDNIITVPEEACDRTNLNGATCSSLGYNGGGVLLCNPTTCTFDTIMCRMTTNQGGSAGSPPSGWGKPPVPDHGADAGTEDAG